MPVNERYIASIMSCLDRFDHAVRGCSFTAEEGAKILERMKQSATYLLCSIVPGAPVVVYVPDELRQADPKQLESAAQESNGQESEQSQ